jgi:DNA-binding transcriptional ArsR family regulator
MRTAEYPGPSVPSATRLDATFAALADPTRRAILERLALSEAPVGELAAPFHISGPAISRHLRVLADAGLVERRIDARWRICRLSAAPLAAAHGWLDQYRRYWEESLGRLAELLEEPPGEHKPPAPPAPPQRAPRKAAPQRKRR